MRWPSACQPSTPEERDGNLGSTDQIAETLDSLRLLRRQVKETVQSVEARA